MDTNYDAKFEASCEAGFAIISEAGDAKSKAMEAIKLIQNYRFEEAEATLKTSKECLRKAHLLQTELIQQEINGDRVDINVLMVHSQDHFAMATVALDLAEISMTLYKKLQKMEGGETQ